MQLMDLPKKILHCGELSLDLSVPQVMGILNVTPDSFSDGGEHNGKVQAIEHAKQMIADGATVIDVGGESTRPGASVVEVEEEIRRVVPVVEALAELDVPVIIMHMRGEPTTMNGLDHYDDVTQDVITELSQRVDDALKAGVRPENIMIDPGFGFAKNAKQNLKLLKEFHQLNQLGYPILSALSRKRFIGEALGGADARQRAVGSVAGHLMSIQQGASMVRAHDVKAMSDAIKVWNAMNLA